MPTPRARDHAGPVSPELVSQNSQGWTTTRKGTGVTYGATLPDVVNKMQKMWPTPRAMTISNKMERLTPEGRMSADGKQRFGLNLQDAVKMWPTPRASEWKDVGPVGSKSHTHMDKRDYLCAKVKDPEQPTGSLNPQWVEWLMGYPIGWTDLKD